MLERLIEQRQAICAAEIECKINTELSSQSWQLAEKVVKVLKPFEGIFLENKFRGQIESFKNRGGAELKSG